MRVVLGEIEYVLASSETDFTELKSFICRAERIVCVGAGRVGLVMDAFAKRLVHLGFSAHSYWDVTLPKIGARDLLLVGSGSGNTRSVALVAQIAKETGVSIALVTANHKSILGDIADIKVILNCPHKETPASSWKSAQPMTTLFEQSLYVWLDSFVLYLISSLEILEIEMQGRHNAIE